MEIVKKIFINIVSMASATALLIGLFTSFSCAASPTDALEKTEIERHAAETDGAKPPSSNWKWQVAAVGLALGIANLSIAEGNRYNELADKNKSLKYKYAVSTTVSERAASTEKYKSNQFEMGVCEQNTMLLDRFAAYAVLWEIYLLFLSDASPLKTDNNTSVFVPEFNIYSTKNDYVSSLTWSRRF